MIPTKETLRKGQPVKITWQGQTVTAKFLEWSDKYHICIVDYNGRRLHRNAKDDGTPAIDDVAASKLTAEMEEPEESRFTVEQRFAFLAKMARMVGKRQAKSFIITGEGGLGKSFTVRQQFDALGLQEILPLKDEHGKETDEMDDGDYIVIKGFSTPKAMYRALWNNRDKIVVFDDCDSVLKNDTATNLLKGALDSYGVRRISWLTELSRIDDDLPKSFDFEGFVIFISNHRLEDMPQALVSRSLIVDVSMTSAEKIERMRGICQAVENDMTLEAKMEVIEFLDGLRDKIGDLNMRTFLKVCDLYSDDPADWRDVAEYMVTAM